MTALLLHEGYILTLNLHNTLSMIASELLYVATNSSTFSWSSKNICAKSGGRTLTPADFLRHNPNRASMDTICVPPSCYFLYETM